MLAIAANTFDKPSETFIRAHVTHIAPGRTVLICREDGGAAQFGCPVLSDVAPLPRPRHLPERIANRLRFRWRTHVDPAASGRDEARVRAFLQRHGVTAVLAEYGLNGALLRRACTRAGVPLYVHFHGFDATKLAGKAHWRRHYRRLFRDATGVVVPSKFLAGRLRDLGCPQDNKGPWPHFMRKEIEEQPESLARLLSALVDPAAGTLKPILPRIDFAAADRIVLLACGTAHYACHLASYWIEQYARLPVEVDIASDYRYRNRPLTGREIVIAVSQSGETADTLSALKALAGRVAARVAVVNVATSSIAREADAILDILAGPEIGVASTKAYSGQAMALLAIALKAARDRGMLSDDRLAEILADLVSVPRIVAETLRGADDIQDLARRLSPARDMFFLGRGVNHPMALEAALKMKEISYIHAEAYPAGELKHGPIALIETGTPVVVFENVDDLNEKTASNVAEVAARGADVVRVGPSGACDLVTPAAGPVGSLFANAAIAQLLSYFVALEKGTDVDQPRNLAKSVTVE